MRSLSPSPLHVPQYDASGQVAHPPNGETFVTWSAADRRKTGAPGGAPPTPLSCGLQATEGWERLATVRSFEAGSCRIQILDDGVFITDAGNLFGGSRKAKIKGSMHPVLVQTGESLVLLDAGFGLPCQGC